MVSYLSLLIETGMFDLIKMSFLPVGHTHEDIETYEATGFQRVPLQATALARVGRVRLHCLLGIHVGDLGGDLGG